ncbi:hypothetical protein BKA56DRAFT_667895 [Ilyonectria sp. MPI-CAGE-AT-0026]|nr:hypothetical protein BKA56DRAFT_667895 [Ilyonectria sp. MPI-CAGE-AT-0026]
MAAPAEKTINNLTGKWTLNKDLSENPDSIFALQGIGYLTRKAIGLAPVTLEMKQYEAAPNSPSTATGQVTHVDMVQLAAGLKGVQEDRCMDNVFRESSDWIFGTTQCQSRWAKVEEIDEEFLKDGWLVEGEDSALIFSHTESKANGWTLTQVWGFEMVNGERRYCRRMVAKKGSKRATVRMVHNYVSQG